ncbi:MAG: carboxypeptidase M32 [Rectinemataceae bacterium]
MRKELERLVELDREKKIVAHIGALLGWDQETGMPEKAVDERSEQLAMIQGLAHAKAVRPEVGELLTKLGSTSENPPGDPALAADERAFLRVLRRAYDRDTKLPADLVEEMARTTSLAQPAWVKARKEDDFASFAPHLEKILELERRVATCLGPGKPPYDVLLDLYEPGSTEASIAELFSRLRADLVKILGKIKSLTQVDDSFLHEAIGEGRQRAVSDWLMDVLAFDPSRGRLDISAHPFTTTLGSDDVRITTRYLENFIPSSIFSTMHETGHALYELGLAPGASFAGTELAEAASMAIHESQSRMWENMVGRGEAFWKGHFHKLVDLVSPTWDGLGREDFLRAVNKVEPSQIRTEADEVTYGLHIILRFELEADLISGRLAVKDLPKAWNAKTRELLGIEVRDDAHGCLQDVHWSAALFGYFPSYTLGNLYAAQFWEAMRKDLPDIDARIEAGDTASLLAWLRDRIHKAGGSYLPGELVERVTGHALDPSHFVSYLDRKYARVYGY